jgi:putative DNA primase/helicase
MNDKNFNEEDVRKTYKLLNHENETEIRVIDTNDKTENRFIESFFVKNEDDFVKVCREFNGRYNIYAGINERIHCGTKKEHVTSVKTIVIDIDPIRKSGNKDDPSTQEELNEADKVACQIQYDFVQQGYEKPLRVMSGNGIQLWFSIPKIEIANENREIVDEKIKCFVDKIREKYENEKVRIDQIGNIDRIIKVIGTKSVKGTPTIERPHRVSGWVDKTEIRRYEDPRLRDYITLLEIQKKEILLTDFKPISDEQLKKLFEKDEKLKDLFEGKWEKYGFPTRSEAEESLVCKLVSYGIPKEQIFAIIDSSKIGKWREKTLSYKELTYKKALEFVSEIKDITKENLTNLKNLDSEKYFSQEVSPGKFVPEYLAQDMMDRVKFITLSDSEEIYWFDEEEGIWRSNGDILIKKMGTDLLGDKTKQNYLNETIGYIQGKTYYDRKIFDSSIINPIPLQNGVLDLNTMQLLPYSPEFYFTSKLNIKYNPNADCPKIKKFLGEIVDPNDVDLLTECPGYCLYRKYLVQKALMLVGDGANGKSTYLSLLTIFLSPENVSSVSLQDLERNRFASSNLYRKLANIYADLPGVALQNPGLFKMLTGGDMIPGEKKFKNTFFFVNYAKLIFSANQVPFIADESTAFFRRWIIVNFPNKFENDKANPLILQELTTEDELSGFLNLAIEGLRRILQKGFSYSKSTEEIREAYIRASNPIGSFVLDCVAQSPNDFVIKEELYTAYNNYCRNKKLTIVDKSVFSKKIRVYVQVEDFRPTVENKRVHAWKGIKLVQPDQDVQLNSHFNTTTESNNIKIGKNMDTPDTLDKFTNKSKVL